jgi:hypothetical protein
VIGSRSKRLKATDNRLIDKQFDFDLPTINRSLPMLSCAFTLKMNNERDIDELNDQVNRTFNIDGFNVNDFSNWIETMEPDQLNRIAIESGLYDLDFDGKQGSQSTLPLSSCAFANEPRLDRPNASSLCSSSQVIYSFKSSFEVSSDEPSMPNHSQSSPSLHFSSSNLATPTCRPLLDSNPTGSTDSFDSYHSMPSTSGRKSPPTVSSIRRSSTPLLCHHSHNHHHQHRHQSCNGNLPTIEMALIQSRFDSNCRLNAPDYSNTLQTDDNCSECLPPTLVYGSLDSPKCQYKFPHYQIDRHLFEQLEQTLTSVWPLLMNQEDRIESPVNDTTFPPPSCHLDGSIEWSPEGDGADESDQDDLDWESEVTSNQSTQYGARKQIKLWQFLLHLLQDKRFERVIGWIDESNGVFRIHQTRCLSRLWGIVKGRPAMNYDKLSRSMRQYYNRQILVKPIKSTRLIYTFNSEFLTKKRF